MAHLVECVQSFQVIVYYLNIHCLHAKYNLQKLLFTITFHFYFNNFLSFSYLNKSFSPNFPKHLDDTELQDGSINR